MNVTLNLASTITANEMFLAECGLAIHGHGFADTFGSVDESGWHGLSTISAVTLLNVGETTLSEKFRRTFGEATLDVWTFVNGDGFKTARACEESDQTLANAFYDAQEADAAE